MTKTISDAMADQVREICRFFAVPAHALESMVKLDRYQTEARAIGIDLARADAILAEEMRRSMASRTITASDALENARRRLLPEAMGEIQLTDPKDIAYSRLVQGAWFCRTTLPSGLVTPEYGMTLIGTKLVPMIHSEWVAANERREAKSAEEKKNG